MIQNRETRLRVASVETFGIEGPTDGDVLGGGLRHRLLPVFRPKHHRGRSGGDVCVLLTATSLENKNTSLSHTGQKSRRQRGTNKFFKKLGSDA